MYYKLNSNSNMQGDIVNIALILLRVKLNQYLQNAAACCKSNPVLKKVWIGS